MVGLDLSHLLTLAAGAGITGGGFLLRRWITGAPALERVAHFAALADVLAKLRQHGLSPEEVASLGSFVNSKEREKALTAAALALPLTALPQHEAGAEPEDYWTQGAMTTRAFEALENTTNELHATFEKLAAYWDDPADLQAVQTLWEEFREAHANFAMRQYEGGSIAPMIYASEAELLTQQRLAWVKAELEDHYNKAGGPEVRGD